MLELNLQTMPVSLEKYADRPDSLSSDSAEAEWQLDARRALIEALEVTFEEAGIQKQRVAFEKGQVPYPGLGTFGENDAAVFFGREDNIDRCIEDLTTLHQGHTGRNFYVILGASGAGKSSLLRAGVISRLKLAHRDEFYVLPTLRPGRRALSGNKEGFYTVLREAFAVGKNYPEKLYAPAVRSRQPQQLLGDPAIFPRLAAHGGITQGEAKRACLGRARAPWH